jgi:hypothetical protein
MVYVGLLAEIVYVRLAIVWSLSGSILSIMDDEKLSGGAQRNDMSFKFSCIV